MTYLIQFNTQHRNSPMQSKTMIIIALVAGLALVIFNIAISYNEPDTVSAEIASTEVANTDNTANTNDDIANKPLGQQPKAILDKANNQIEQAQQLESDKMAQLEGQ